MYVFPPGSGCTGIPKLVQPGDELSPIMWIQMIQVLFQIRLNSSM